MAVKRTAFVFAVFVVYKEQVPKNVMRNTAGLSIMLIPNPKSLITVRATLHQLVH